MKFSEIELSAWEELRPYLDTCLIPVTALSGTEQPYEVTGKLERLRDIMDCIEIPFKGRVVTYPAFQYGDAQITELINNVCRNTKLSGFKYAIVISADAAWTSEALADADLIVTSQAFPDYKTPEGAEQIRLAVQAIWQNSGLN
ncbi:MULTISPECIES: DUF2487 family protein [unclassified Paenibacillus]|uniref:DUF2487 family protein n=1 Tax=unclassified Paenibacillus TaxID=185978 RepID=UPI000838F80F|nr:MULTISPECIES: DUF2487 family protein [unclassified Paenibacillus]NWL87282.1 DUF2487 domain-containing protein [Paenibacillus sp. 79R4]